MDQLTASAVDRAAVAAVMAALGPVVVVRMVPVTVATAGGQRQRTEVMLFDALGATLHERVDEEGHEIARDTVRAAFPGRVWNRAFDYHVGTGVLLEVAVLRLPPASVVPLAEALGVVESEWRPNGGHDADCAYVGGVGPHCTCEPVAEPDDAPIPYALADAAKDAEGGAAR